jgi:hypothetical protein
LAKSNGLDGFVGVHRAIIELRQPKGCRQEDYQQQR